MCVCVYLREGLLGVRSAALSLSPLHDLKLLMHEALRDSPQERRAAVCACVSACVCVSEYVRGCLLGESSDLLLCVCVCVLVCVCVST